MASLSLQQLIDMPESDIADWFELYGKRRRYAEEDALAIKEFFRHGQASIPPGLRLLTPAETAQTTHALLCSVAPGIDWELRPVRPNNLSNWEYERALFAVSGDPRHIPHEDD